MSKLLEEMRDLIRTLHYTYRSEEACLHWIGQYILFPGKRHPTEMGVGRGQRIPDASRGQTTGCGLNSESGARASSVSL